VNGKIQVVYGIVYFFRKFEFQMLVSVIHMVHNYCFICFVLVKDDQNVVYVSFVVYYFFTFQPLFYIYISSRN
jgi:hypothetical protein